MRKRTNIKSIKIGDVPNKQVSENKAVEQVKHRQVVHQEWAKLMAANPPRNVKELGLQRTGDGDLHSVARARAKDTQAQDRQSTCKAHGSTKVSRYARGTSARRSH